MSYTRSMGQQPWWFQLLAAGSDESDDEDFVPPVQQQRLVRQRAVEPVPREAAYESDTGRDSSVSAGRQRPGGVIYFRSNSVQPVQGVQGQNILHKFS